MRLHKGSQLEVQNMLVQSQQEKIIATSLTQKG